MRLFRVMIAGYDPRLQALLASLFTWGVTALGAALVFVLPASNKTFLGNAVCFVECLELPVECLELPKQSHSSNKSSETLFMSNNRCGSACRVHNVGLQM